VSGKFQLLGGSVVATVDGTAREVAGRAGWVAAALLLEGFVSKQKIRVATSLSDVAIRKLISRTAACAGLTLVPERGVGWHLDRTGLSIDAVDLVNLVEGSEYASDEDRATSLFRARSLWKSGLPSFPDLGLPSDDMYLRVQRAYRTAMASGRRILVVDDQIAEAVANALRTRHVCETARSFDEYRQYEPRLNDFGSKQLTTPETPSQSGSTTGRTQFRSS
jgi:hypothetical protein